MPTLRRSLAANVFGRLKSRNRGPLWADLLLLSILALASHTPTYRLSVRISLAASVNMSLRWPRLAGWPATVDSRGPLASFW